MTEETRDSLPPIPSEEILNFMTLTAQNMKQQGGLNESIVKRMQNFEKLVEELRGELKNYLRIKP